MICMPIISVNSSFLCDFVLSNCYVTGLEKQQKGPCLEETKKQSIKTPKFSLSFGICNREKKSKEKKS